MTDTAMRQVTKAGESFIRVMKADREQKLQQEVNFLEAEREENEATIENLRTRLEATRKARAKAELRTLIVLCAALAELSAIALLIGMSL
jgi:hypothetical protein